MPEILSIRRGGPENAVLFLRVMQHEALIACYTMYAPYLL